MTDQHPDDIGQLPWVLRQGSLRVLWFGIDDDGRTTLSLRSTTRGSPLVTVTVHMRSLAPVDWVFGYVIRDGDGNRTRYRGRFGDPQFDKKVIE